MVLKQPETTSGDSASLWVYVTIKWFRRRRERTAQVRSSGPLAPPMVAYLSALTRALGYLFRYKKGSHTQTHTHKQTILVLFDFLFFISPFSFWILKEAFHERAFLFIYSYLYRRKYYTTFSPFRKQPLEDNQQHILITSILIVLFQSHIWETITHNFLSCHSCFFLLFLLFFSLLFLIF